MPYTDVIQQLVDALAGRIQRSVSVDEQHGGLIVSSRHFGDADKLRIDSVLSRRVPARVAEYLNSFGIATADRPLSVPGNPSLGLVTRRCYPIRDHGRLLGYLWLIGDDAERFDEVVADYVIQVSVRLHDRLLQVAEEERRRRQLVADLLRGGEGCDRAARELVGQGLVGPEDEVVVIAAGAGTDPEAVAAVLAETIGRGSPDAYAVRALATSVGNRGAVLVAGRDEVERAAAWLAEAIRHGVRRRDADDGYTFVGLSNAGRLHLAPELLRQAVLTAFVAAEFPELTPVLSWRGAGVYGPLMLAALASPDLVVPPQIVDLSAGGRTDSLAHTAEVFLDAAGDTATASEQLMIHRTTLYYRLTRIEKKTGCDLKNGRDRLTLHLGLKMKRLLDSDIPAFLRQEQEPWESS
nr:helix-turn-helix domain-containing protein [Streptomyces sp. SID3343]